MIICYYHRSDLDGQCSGAIVKRRFPNVKLVPIDHYQQPRWNQLRKDDTVIIVDFNFTAEQMKRLENTVSELIWIDHHISAISDASYNHGLPGKRDIGKAACELVWEYFYPDLNMPAAVHYIGRYDVWDFDDPRTLPFQYGMRALDNVFPSGDIWELLLNVQDHPEESNAKVNELVDTGQLLLRYQIRQNEKIAKGASFETRFEGFQAICLNVGYNNSLVYDSVFVPERHQIMISFMRQRNGKWRYTLYSNSETVDVSEIAKKYGGGGHQRAAGFVTNRCLF